MKSFTRGLAGLLAISSGALMVAACSSSSASSKADPGIDVATKTITIGVTGPKTGPLASLGESLTAEQAVVNQVDATGGINGWKLKLVTYDDQWLANVGLSDYERLVDSDHIFAIAGGAGPGLTAALSFLQQNNVPVIGANLLTSLIAVNFPTTKVLSSYTALEASYTAFCVQYGVKKLGATSVSVVAEAGANSTSDIPGVSLGAKLNGIQVKKAIPLPAAATDLSGYAAALKSAGAPVVVAFIPPNQLPDLVKAASSIGYSPKWIGAFYDNDPSLYSLYGSNLQNMYFLSLWDALTSGTPGVQQMLSTITKYSSDKSPTNQAVFGYIGIELFVDVLRDATAHGATPSRARLISALHSGQRLDPGNLGLTLTYPTDGTAVPTQQVGSIVQVQNGKSVVVYGPSALPSVPKQYIVAPKLTR